MKTHLHQVLLTVPPEEWRVRQAIVFEWYDGPRDGLCELESPACAFHFTIIAERWSEGRLDDRLFRLTQIDIGSVARAISILHRAGPPTTPVWAPHGPYEDEDERRRIEDAIEEIVARGVVTEIVCRTKDMIRFTEVWLQTHAS